MARSCHNTGFPKDLKIDQEEYLVVMKDVVKAWIDANYGDVDYVW